MATDRRRAAATATSGAVLTTAGGVLRHQGVREANLGVIPAWKVRHPLSSHQTRALLRTGARGRRRYLLGATLGLAGAPALAVGIHDTFSRKETASKRDHQRSFVEEGLRGTTDALAQRAEGIKEVPPQHKAGPLTVAAVSGAGGSWGTHLLLNRAKAFQGGRHHGGRAGLAALGGTTAAALSYPLARRTVRSNEYEVTPTGVRRKKKAPVRPSSKASRAQARPRSLTVDMQKRDRNVYTALQPSDKAIRRHHSPNVVLVNGRKAANQDEAHEALSRIARTPSWRNTHDIEIKHHGKPGRELGVSSMTLRPRPLHRIPAVRAGAGAAALGLALPAIRMHTRSERAVRQKRESGKFAKADRRTSVAAQRAAILAAGTTPVIGGVAAARTAGHFAPPGHRGSTERRQYGYTAGGSIAGGLAGAYGTAALASRHSGVAEATERAAAAHGRAKEKVLNLKPVNRAIARLPKGGARTDKARAVARGVKQTARTSRVAAPLRKAPIAAGVGYVAGKTVGGFAGSGLAMHRNEAEQKAYALKHPVVKFTQNMTVAERRKLSRKKRIAAVSSTATGLMGLGALGARLAHRPELGVKLLTGSAAIGGANSLNFAGVLRREARAQDPRVKKFAPRIVFHGTDEPSAASIESGGFRDAPGMRGHGTYVANNPHSAVNWANDRSKRAKTKPSVIRGVHVGPVGDDEAGHLPGSRYLMVRGEHVRPVGREGLKKPLLGAARLAKADRREPLSRMRADQAAAIVRQHGDAGPLPSTLSRQDRMKAYEARYVHAGGHKGEKWQRRADTADKVKVGGLAGATMGGAGILALRHPRVAGALGHRAAAARHAADTATIGAATVSGAGELYAGHARRRRSSYSNSKAGVAASALRRMRDYQA